MEPNTQPSPVPQQPTTETQSVAPPPAPTASPASDPLAAPVATPSVTPDNQPAINPALAKKIKDSGNSVFFLGIFLTVILSLVCLAVVASHTKGANQSARLVLAALEILLGIGMVVYGHRLKKMTADRGKALSALTVSIGLSAGVLVLSIIESTLKKPVQLPLQGLLALITVVYLIIVRLQLKKLH